MDGINCLILRPNCLPRLDLKLHQHQAAIWLPTTWPTGVNPTNRSPGRRRGCHGPIEHTHHTSVQCRRPDRITHLDILAALRAGGRRPLEAPPPSGSGGAASAWRQYCPGAGDTYTVTCRQEQIVGEMWPRYRRFVLVFLPNRNTLLLIFFVSQCYVTLGKLKITDSYSRVD